MQSIKIVNAQVVNEGQIRRADVLIKEGRIAEIAETVHASADRTIEAEHLHLIPGIIDDQVHFREPGLTHKADLTTESRAALAGGVTSFMEMPNTKPAALTQELLEEKYARAAQVAATNYSFFMGASNDNIDEVLRTPHETVCGLKVFMGSSTGNMLVDDRMVLEKIFSQSPMLIATHCEDEDTVRANERAFRERYGEEVPIELHPEIRSVEACLKSSSLAVELAKQYNARLHILHLTTQDELSLFDNSLPLKEKRITSEVCVHHLYFNADDYAQYGTQIKCNPAVKAKKHQEALFEALLDDRLDIIATDHAPHTWEEKQNSYFSAPSGVPLIQHTLNVMLEFYQQGKISLETIVKKMCHAPADCFRVKERGFIREGYWADLALVDLNKRWTVDKQGLFYKCGWSPFEGHEFQGKVTHTFINGVCSYENGALKQPFNGKRLRFESPLA